MYTKDLPKENEFIAGEGIYFGTDMFETGLNNNVMVVGGSGSGKTRNVIMPNLLQMNGSSSAIISDPKDVLYDSFNEYLKNRGYSVKKIDLTHPEESSSHFNIFDFIKNENDIVKLSHIIISTGEGKNKSNHKDIFWDETSEILLQSIIFYMFEELSENERNMKKVVELLNFFFVPFFEKIDFYIESDQEIRAKREERRKYQKSGIPLETKLDKIMIDLEFKKPDSIAVKKFKAVRCSADVTYQSILVSVHAKVEKYSTPALDMIMCRNDIDFVEMGERPTVCFFVCSDTDRSQDDLGALFFSIALNELCDSTLKNSDRRLKLPVRIILDDAAASLKIESLPEYISMVRSRNISIMVVVQSEGQLKTIYEKDAQTIIDNCDTYIFLGSNSVETADSVAKRSNENLYSILQLPVGEGRVFRRGSVPIKCKVFDTNRFIEIKNKERNDLLKSDKDKEVHV